MDEFDHRVLLIGGTSHVGKSTLAKRVASERDWNLLSTDQLSRHPGRPWRDDNKSLPGDVASYYSSTNTRALVDDVTNHYRKNVWPIVAAVVRSHLNNRYDPCLVFEGAAIHPEDVLAAKFVGVKAIWLTASDELIEARIRASSQYDGRTEAEQQRVRAFLARSLALNKAWVAAATATGQQVLDNGRVDAYHAVRK